MNKTPRKNYEAPFLKELSYEVSMPLTVSGTHEGFTNDDEYNEEGLI